MPSLSTLLTLLLPLLPPTLSQGFSGRGHIAVWPSSDWRTATPSLKAGCLSTSGALVPSTPASNCGIFTPFNVYPYTLSTSAGNCTFNDASREQNTDSAYGRGDYGYFCGGAWVSDVFEELYVIDGMPYPFLCNGDVNCYYDAKRLPGEGEELSLWPFRWGSQQLGITPGHVQLLLVWEKID